MQVPCPACGKLIAAEELVHEVDGPPLCASCAAFELVRRGPRKSTTSARRTSSSSSGSIIKGFFLGFFCCPSFLGLFMPNVGVDTKKGILLGFIVSTAISFAIESYRASQGLPPMYSY